MEYEPGHYYRVKYTLLLSRNSFLKDPPKDNYEECTRKVINRAYFIFLNKVDEFDGTNKRLLNFTGRILKNIEKCDIMLSHYSSRLANRCGEMQL